MRNPAKVRRIAHARPFINPAQLRRFRSMPSAPQFEYRRESSVMHCPIDFLNKLGKQGWELVDVFDSADGLHRHTFKRSVRRSGSGGGR